MFWKKIAQFILKNRVSLLVTILALSAFMGYEASQVRLSYELAKVLPSSDPNFQLYESFKARYGEDGNVMVIGVATDKMFDLAVFNEWYDLNKSIKKIGGIKEVVSNANLFAPIRNDSLKRFDFQNLVPKKPTTQAEIDSVRKKIETLPFYKGYIISNDGKAHLMAVTFDQSALNTKGRIEIAHEIKREAEAFAKKIGVEVHLSGLPHIRTEFTAQVSREIVLFTVLAVLVTGLILLVFFRSIRVTLISVGVVLLGVLWCVGYMGLFGYSITLLTGLLPALIVVIGVPNSIFLTNKYHEEYARSGNKIAALELACEKIGETTFWANLTTSIGFVVLVFTGSILLVEFGWVSALSVLSTYVICLVLITIIYSYLKPPKNKHLELLEGKRIRGFLNIIEGLVAGHRKVVYGVILVLSLIGFYGMTKIEANGFIVDDLPKNHPIYSDLKFFEQHFKGVMPFEVSIDTGRPGRVFDPQTLNKIKLMQREVEKYDEFTKPISLVEAIKFFYQGYRGGDPKYYILPPALELNKLAEYTSTVKGKENRFASFIDSTKRYTRVSFQMTDAGTRRSAELYKILQPKIDSIFNFDRSDAKWAAVEDRYEAKITGNSVVFMKGNEYLLKNLVESTLLAIGLIALLMVLLFGNWRMILIAVIPSLVPLVVTAGIMGFFNIDLKPSTTLIFSIAFGLSSDGTIYFLTKFKDEVRKNGLSVGDAIFHTIRYTGISMVYTAFILFVGFAIFTASTFQGTVVLGILVSITLLMGMLSNLVLLPSFLMWLKEKI